MDNVADINQEILRLELSADALPPGPSEDRTRIEREVEALRDRLSELQSTPAPKPGPSDVDQAKEHIGTVEDIFGAKSPEEERLRQLRAERAKAQREMDDLSRQPYTVDTPTQYQDSQQHIHDLDREIAALDPTTASLDLLNESALDVGRDDNSRRVLEEEQRRQAARDIELATAAVAHGTKAANQGDLERAVNEADLADPVTTDNARASDDLIERHGCGPRVLAGVSILVVIAVILTLALTAGGDDSDTNSTDSSTQSANAAPLTTDAVAEPSAAPVSEPSVAPSSSQNPSSGAPRTSLNPFPPSADDLPQGALLFQGRSGDWIGCIACDGQSRFLSLSRRGVGVGDAASAALEEVWNLNGQVTEFGARLTAPNKGRYGVNLWIDGSQYGPGVALEVGEQAAVFVWSPERDGPLRAGTRMSIIIGEQGVLADQGGPAAYGDYELEWWFVFQPD